MQVSNDTALKLSLLEDISAGDLRASRLSNRKSRDDMVLDIASNPLISPAALQDFISVRGVQPIRNIGDFYRQDFVDPLARRPGHKLQANIRRRASVAKSSVKKQQKEQLRNLASQVYPSRVTIPTSRQSATALQQYLSSVGGQYNPDIVPLATAGANRRNSTRRPFGIRQTVEGTGGIRPPIVGPAGALVRPYVPQQPEFTQQPGFTSGLPNIRRRPSVVVPQQPEFTSGLPNIRGRPPSGPGQFISPRAGGVPPILIEDITAPSYDVVGEQQPVPYFGSGFVQPRRRSIIGPGADPNEFLIYELKDQPLAYQEIARREFRDRLSQQGDLLSTNQLQALANLADLESASPAALALPPPLLPQPQPLPVVLPLPPPRPLSVEAQAAADSAAYQADLAAYQAEVARERAQAAEDVALAGLMDFREQEEGEEGIPALEPGQMSLEAAAANDYLERVKLEQELKRAEGIPLSAQDAQDRISAEVDAINLNAAAEQPRRWYDPRRYFGRGSRAEPIEIESEEGFPPLWVNPFGED